jgi:hypothetical protein
MTTQESAAARNEWLTNEVAMHASNGCASLEHMRAALPDLVEREKLIAREVAYTELWDMSQDIARERNALRTEAATLRTRVAELEAAKEPSDPWHLPFAEPQRSAAAPVEASEAQPDYWTRVEIEHASRELARMESFREQDIGAAFRIAATFTAAARRNASNTQGGSGQ